MNVITPLPLVSKMPFAPEEAVFALGGDTPAHIWVRTCPTLRCECRAALVLASFEGHEVLLDRAASVRAASHAGSGYDEAAELTGLVAFKLDIDAVLAYAPNGDAPLDLADHPEVAAVATLLDGNVMDAVGRLWFHGKGLPDPEERLRAEGNAVTVKGWQSGQMLGWAEANLDVREDAYFYKKNFYMAFDKYCPIAGCDCGEVLVNFCAGSDRQRPLGHVVVKSNGEILLVPERNSEHLIMQLWSMYSARYPDFLLRLQAREKVMKTLDVAGVSAQARSAKVGRNDPCSCGSGKKYKKCCGAKP